MKRLIFLALGLLLAPTGFSKTVGIYKDQRAIVNEGLLKTLQEGGWNSVMLDAKSLTNESTLAGLDVIYFSSGWGVYFFPDFDGRMSMTRFVAGGKGILSAGFRSGYARTANRPLFPQVGAAFNRVNGSFIIGTGESVLAKAIDHPFSAGGWDHVAIKVGPEGHVFAEVGGDPVGVYGEPYGGRYVAFGAFLGSTAKSNAMQGAERAVFLKTLEWLGSAPRKSVGEQRQLQDAALMDLLRRERKWDWTLNERGPDRGPGLIPSVRNRLAVPLESRLYQLEYMSAFLPPETRSSSKRVITDLKNAVVELDAHTRRFTDEVIAKIDAMNLAELTAGGRGADGKAFELKAEEPVVSERLFPAERLAALKNQADKVIAQYRPLVQAAKARQFAEEHQADLAKVPDLIKQASSVDVEVRRSAILELGRIGDFRATQTLIAALSDQDEKVRVNAILGLAWMQSRDATPFLVKLAEGSDVFMRRRAVQALGQIGDARATPAVLARISDADLFTAENAIFSLGWLKAKEAVPELLKIIATFDKSNARQRCLMLAAIRALGYIGDPDVLPVLNKIKETAGDYPLVGKKKKRLLNIYSTPQSLGLAGQAELAMAAIQAGGAPGPGIKQAEFLSSSDRFYALTKRFNALAGRPFITLNSSFKDDWAALLPYLKQAGMTGLHNAWGEEDVDPVKFQELIQAAGDLDLLWVDALPTDDNFFGGKQAYSDRRQFGLEKSNADAVFQHYQAMPAFAGFWSEETYPGVKCEKGEFEAWFRGKYGIDPLKKYGLPSDFIIPYIGQGVAELIQVGAAPLKTEYLAFCGEKMLDSWRESQEWMHGVRKGSAFTYVVSHRHVVSYLGVTGKAGDVIDVIGPESYQSFGHDNAFLMEMHKDGKARPVMTEFYNWYSPSAAHEIRGYAQQLMHGECFFNFDLHQVFEQASAYYLWNWDNTRWNNIRAIFRKAETLKSYLSVPASAANVAQLCSEATACHYQDYRNPLGSRWYQNQASLWTALQQSQIPADVIWAETLSPEALARYRVIVMVDAKMLSDDQAEMIREWVKQGGVLIAGGSSSLFDSLPATRKNYSLADVFGVQYEGFAGESDPSRNDTLTFRLGSEPLPVESSMDLPAARDHVYREFKPKKSIGVYKVTASSVLPGLAAGAACEYDMPLGYDRVKRVSAESVAAFANGDPAVTLNKVGKGLCYFWTPIYPGLCYQGSAFENDANFKDFWPNAREVLASMVKGGLIQQQATLPVELGNVSKEVEVTVRQQPEKDRMMVHLLNYDTRQDKVKAPNLTVYPPIGKTVKRLFYPDTETVLAFTPGPGGVSAVLRDFSVHDMVVVEWK